MISVQRLAIAGLFIAGAASAQSPKDPGFGQYLFPPEVIMQHQQAIGLMPPQRAAITEAMQKMQSSVIDLQWRMQEETQRLTEIVKPHEVDETAALTQVEKVLGVEREIKKAHLAMLIRIKKTLSAEQLAKLAALRDDVTKE